MKTYNKEELNKKIESFMDRKLQKFPELAKVGHNPRMTKKEFLTSFVGGFHFSLNRRSHA